MNRGNAYIKTLIKPQNKEFPKEKLLEKVLLAVRDYDNARRVLKEAVSTEFLELSIKLINNIYILLSLLEVPPSTFAEVLNVVQDVLIKFLNVLRELYPIETAGVLEPMERALLISTKLALSF